MDKYEFSLKMDQMKKLVHEEDYSTALRIVEGIDWNRVRNTNLLTMAATVYERNDRLKEARRILEQALERTPVGKRILFKLTEVTVRMGDLKSAEDYYYEYRQVDPDDVNIYLLQYMILKARHAPYDRQLQPLELYCAQETDERWLYELVSAYDSAGRKEDLIRTCDRLVLLFGKGSYAAKALRIKMKYTGLTDEQMDILYPRSLGQSGSAAGSAAAGYAGERAGTTRAQAYASDYGLMLEPDPSESAVLRQMPAEEYEDPAAKAEEARRNSDALAALRYDNEDEEFEAYVKAESRSEGRTPVPVADVPDKAAEYTPQEPAAFAGIPTESTSPAAQMPQAASVSVSDEGTQMAFDFGGSFGEPRVVEDTGEPDESLRIEEEEHSQPVPAAEDAQNAAPAAVPAAAAPSQVLTASRGTPPSMGDAISASVSAGLAAERLSASVTMESVSAAPAVPQAPRIPSAASFAGASAGALEAVPVKPSPAPVPVPARPAAAPSQAPVQSVAAPVQSAAAPAQRFHMIVEAETVQEGTAIAVEELRRIHSEHSISHASAKTTAAKLNDIGLSDSILQKIRGKDFVIEGAGSLDRELIDDIYYFIKHDTTGTIVVLVDTPEGLDDVEKTRPELFDICDYVSDIDDEEYEEGADASDDAYEDAFDDGFDDEDDLYDEHAGKTAKKTQAASVSRSRPGAEAKETFSNVRTVAPAADGEEMEIDDFAQYCAQYAAEIDCSITGTSMLALYERIEIMEEDGIALTRDNAEQLIEEAADRAEKPPIGKRITGVFHSKYDKNGCLILKESDFIY